MTRYRQGQFRPRNKEKYVGDIENIFFRSGWEFKFLNWLDKEESVLFYSSEEIVVPYVSPIDGKTHRYFVDIWARIQTNKGVVEYLIEIKPKKQLVLPKKPKKQSKRYVEQVSTYLINLAKWESAKKFADQNNMVFKILTEDELFGKKKG